MHGVQEASTFGACRRSNDVHGADGAPPSELQERQRSFHILLVAKILLHHAPIVISFLGKSYGAP